MRQRDVCQDGFELEKIANAAFLDLPHPWEAIPHAKKSLKQGNSDILGYFLSNKYLRFLKLSYINIPIYYLLVLIIRIIN